MAFSPTAARTFLARTMALPIAGEAFVCITYTVACRDGVERWRSCGVRTLDEADRTMARLTRQPNTRNIYVCMSSQREATAKIVGADGFTIHDVHRSAYGAFALKSLFIDVDVKPGAYATTAEAADALKAFLRATTLPLRRSSSAVAGVGSMLIGCLTVRWGWTNGVLWRWPLPRRRSTTAS